MESFLHRLVSFLLFDLVYVAMCEFPSLFGVIGCCFDSVYLAMNVSVWLNIL